MSPLSKFLIVVLTLGIPAGIWWYSSGGASTTIDLTLTSNSDLETGLVGHWTMDGPDTDWSSTTAEVLDRSGNAYHGNATTSLVGGKDPMPTVGVIGQGMEFDGVGGGGITMPGFTTWSSGNGSVVLGTDHTISMWLNAHDTGLATILGNASLATPFRINDALGTTFDIVYRPSAESVSLTSAQLIYEQWVHATVVRSGATLSLYVNGQYADTTTLVTEAATSAQFNRFGSNSTFANPYEGSLDDVRIYNRVLSAEEVRRLYQLGATTRVAETLTTNPTLETGLVGHWTMDGTDVDWSSTTAEIRDRSGNGNHGDAQGGMTTTSVTPGPLGQGMRFDGVDDYADAETPLVLDLPGALTTCAWTYIESVPNGYDARVIANTNSADTVQQYSFEVENDRSVALYWTGSGTGSLVSGASAVTFNEWYHLCAARNSGSAGTIYVNGVAQSTNVTSNPIATVGFGNTAIARSGSRDASYFDGLIDDVRIYNRALSADEVKRLYELGATTRVAETLTTNPTLETGLIGHWTFDGPDIDWSSTTAEIRDRSGNGNHGDAQGGLTTTSVTGGVLGQGMRFDGTNTIVSLGDLNNETDTVSHLTVALWVYQDEIHVAGDSQMPVAKYDSVNGQWRFKTDYYSGSLEDHVAFGFFYDVYGFTLDPIHEARRWEHWVAVYDGTQSGNSNRLKLFVDGVAQTLGFIGTIPATTGANDVSAIIGAENGGDRAFWNGALDDVRIYNRALSAEEVQRLYGMGR